MEEIFDNWKNEIWRNQKWEMRFEEILKKSKMRNEISRNFEEIKNDKWRNLKMRMKYEKSNLVELLLAGHWGSELIKHLVIKNSSSVSRW